MYKTYVRLERITGSVVAVKADDAANRELALLNAPRLFERVHAIATRSYGFADKEAVRTHFTKLTGLFKNFNYAPPGSQEGQRLLDEIRALDESAPMTARAE